MTLQSAIQKRILDLCAQQGITVNRLCVLADVPQNTISLYFSQEHRDIRFSTLSRLCKGFGISIADFFCCDTFLNIESDPQ